MSKTTSGA